MASYGSLVLNTPQPPKASSFSVRVECAQRAVSASGDGSSFIAKHSKSFNRIAPSSNPMKRAKAFISDYAGVVPDDVWPRGISGCGEASMVRHRSIALARMKSSISGLEFRFRLPS